MQYYKTSQQHIRETMALIDRLIELRVLEKESGKIFLSHPDTQNGPGADQEETGGALQAEIARLRQQIQDREQNTLVHGITVPLMEIRQLFQLTETEYSILTLCLAQRMDLKYQKVVLYYYNTPAIRTINSDFIKQVFATDPADAARIETALLPEATLIRHCLVEYTNPGSTDQGANGLVINERIYRYLLEIGSRTEPGHDHIEFHEKGPGQDALFFSQQQHTELEKMASVIHENQAAPAPLAAFYGPPGTGKTGMVRQLAAQNGKGVVAADLAGAHAAGQEPEHFYRTAEREAILCNALLYIKNIDSIFEDTSFHYARELLTRRLAESGMLLFLGSQKRVALDRYIPGKPCHECAFTVPDAATRKKLWDHYLDRYGLKTDIKTAQPASTFAFSGGQIKNIVENMKNTLGSSSVITGEQINSWCRKHSLHELDRLAAKVTGTYQWEDIILPADQLRQLREITGQVRYRGLVYGTWKFDSKHTTGKGVNALFHGTSGTGKTMAAGIMANELGLDLYKIDLSTVVSKYVGETEKNLSKIFKEAEHSNAVLLFDEADALFGKRSEVKDAHDRYANVEVGYLLQKMEEYGGIVILTSNMLENMDRAFERRMHFIVEFPFPDQAQRQRIWENIFPETVPVADGLDYTFLAKSFTVSGGNIKNIAHAACFYAADDGGAVTMEHLVRATKREYQKIGRACMENEFGEYYRLVQ